MRCTETIHLESLNPKVQGSIPCASTSMLCLCSLTTYMLWLVCRDASPLRHLTASFDSFVEASSFARKPSSNTWRLLTSLAYLIKPPPGDANQAGLVG
jgi:hypothetical protein